MGLRETINEKLLRDGRSAYAMKGSDSFAPLHGLALSVISTSLAAKDKYLLVLPENVAWIDTSFKYFFIACAVIMWSATLYYVAAWRKLKENAPETEGPFFRNSVLAIRRHAFYSSCAIWIIFSFLPPATWDYLRTSFFLYLINGTFYATMYSVFLSELLRAALIKKPWPDKKHIIVVATIAAIHLSISILSFNLSSS